jgi:hypothetical protein
LTFEVQDGETRDVRILQGESLDHFIQQLGLIQNEHSASSLEMQSFVDQFRALSRAAGNILQMFVVGYEKIKISDFICQAGGKFEANANEILKTSEDHLQKFSSWLRITRENSKVSLLFWTEELRELYTLIQLVTSEDTLPAMLSEKLTRLEPLWNHKVDTKNELVSAIYYCAKSSQRRMRRTSNGWLVEVSHFLEELCAKLAGHLTTAAISKQSEIILHSFLCGDEEEAKMTLKILHRIYQVKSRGCQWNSF